MKKALATLVAAALVISVILASDRNRAEAEDLTGSLEFISVPGILLEEISALLPEQVTIFDLHPEFVDSTVDPNLHIPATARIKVTFIDEGAGYRNAFGYFTYADDGTILSEQAIFANASEYGGGGTLVPGDTADLGIFPEGTNLGFYIVSNGFSRGEEVPSDASPENVFYSLDAKNTDGFRHIALIGTQTLVDGAQPLIMGFEDLPGLGDKDYNDAVFLVSISPEEVRDEILATSNIPQSNYENDFDNDGVLNGLDDHPEDPLRAFDNRSPEAGASYFLAFEDLFPEVGDGDYNDIVDAFHITRTTDKNGDVRDVRIVHELIARGASFKHQLRHRVRFVGYTAESVVRRYDRAGRLLETELRSHTNGCDLVIFADTHLALFDDVTGSRFPNTEPGMAQVNGRVTEVELTFNPPISPGDMELAPYDPYLLVEDTGYDIHLVGKTPIAGSSNPDTVEGQTFKNAVGFPFAMLIPGSNWPYPLSTVYVGQAYPDFAEWHHSNGAQQPDWYQRPTSGTRSYEYTAPD
ncbi:MAG: LruC domain-containing protein [Planctomycetota bacterium]|jgi:LruC domain-containing protein